MITGVMLAISEGHPAQLRAAWRTLGRLPVKDRLATGFSWRENGRLKDASFRQFADTFQVMMRAVDPSPVPSFRCVPANRRATHLAAARAGRDADAAGRLLDDVVDALLEESIPARYKSASCSLAIDWTDHETWSRPRPKDDPVPPSDPDASWGHARRNAPGAKEVLFFGYYAGVATMVGETGGEKVPELVRRIAFAPPRTDPARDMASTLVRLSATRPLGDVICDCGYSNRDPKNFATPLRRAGAELVMDLHPADRGPQGDFEGAICCNGQLYCPLTPIALLELDPLGRGASDLDKALHDGKMDELARYKLAPLARPDADGYARLRCPAVAGKLRCPRKPESLRLSGERPTTTPPAPDEPNLPRCCAQDSITVPPQVNAKTRQRHDFGSKAHRLSYARRTAAERTYASLADPSVGGIRRGWCRMFGLGKNKLVYCLAVAVRNLRITESFEKRQAESARRAPSRRKRRRRYETVVVANARDGLDPPLVHPD